MKDAFGGSYMLYIMIIFFVIFISFMTVAINFARAFKIKNNVINIIEKSDPKNNSTKEIEEVIKGYLNQSSYSYSDNTFKRIKKDCNNRKNGSNKFNSFIQGSDDQWPVCLVPKGSPDAYYYEVTSYIAIDFPFFRLGIVIPIRGESKTISSIFN